MENAQGGDVLARKSPPQFLIFVKFLLAEKCPKLGIQLPNAGDDNQSCHILTIIFIRIDWFGFRSIISTLVLYSIQMYQFLHRYLGVHRTLEEQTNSQISWPFSLTVT